jgi:uncharacterized repeat protein (TIGR01451 family)
MTGAPTSVPVHGTLTYIISVRNAGPGAATGVTVTDPLASSVDFGSAVPSQGACSAASGILTCALGTLENGGDATITVHVVAESAGRISNTASVSAVEPDPHTGDNHASARNDALGPDLAVAVTASPDPVAVGGLLTYQITVTNSGPGSATRVTLTDELPAQTSSVSMPGGCSETGGSISCTLGTLGNGDQVTVTIVVRVTKKGSLRNNVSVAANENDPHRGDVWEGV